MTDTMILSVCVEGISDFQNIKQITNCKKHVLSHFVEMIPNYVSC